MTDFPSTLEKANRKVRFSLPEAKLIFPTNKRNSDGTSKLGNETLINVVSPQNAKADDASFRPGSITRSNLKSNGESRSNLNFRPNSSNANTCYEPCEARFKPATNIYSVYKSNGKPLNRQSFGGLPTIERKASSLDDTNYSHFDETCFSNSNLTKYKSSDDLRDSTKFKIKSVIKLPETEVSSAGSSSRRKSSNFLKVPEYKCER